MVWYCTDDWEESRREDRLGLLLRRLAALEEQKIDKMLEWMGVLLHDALQRRQEEVPAAPVGYSSDMTPISRFPSTLHSHDVPITLISP